MNSVTTPSPPPATATGEIYLTVHGEARAYPRTKEGKRQAILDGLAAIPTLTVDGAVYLPDAAALQVVASALYPDGIQTTEAYQVVAQTTAKACAHIGFGEAVELTPPAVPFAARGSYRRQYPPLDEEKVRQQLRLVPTRSDRPQQALACLTVWTQSGWERYGRRWPELNAGQQAVIQTQVDEIAAHEGWQKEGAGDDSRYVRPLPLDEAGAHRRLDDYLRKENGRPVAARSVHYQACLGAYGRGFYIQELPPALADLVAATLAGHGYHPVATGDEYRPAPLELVDGVTLAEKLAALTPVTTEFGPALLLGDVLTAVLRQARSVGE